METNDRVFIGLGSNLPSRRDHLQAARDRINQSSDIVQSSRVRETEPVGVTSSNSFLNQVIQVRPSESATPEQYLEYLLSIETDLGRDRSRAPDRVIDLDLLYWGRKIRDKDPILPHPRVHHRRFVLEPMVELAPEFIHPRLEKSQVVLLGELQ